VCGRLRDFAVVVTEEAEGNSGGWRVGELLLMDSIRAKNAGSTDIPNESNERTAWNEQNEHGIKHATLNLEPLNIEPTTPSAPNHARSNRIKPTHTGKKRGSMFPFNLLTAMSFVEWQAECRFAGAVESTTGDSEAVREQAAATTCVCVYRNNILTTLVPPERSISPRSPTESKPIKPNQTNSHPFC
jgi:hypothetical protein